MTNRDKSMNLMYPYFWVNFKIYSGTSGPGGVEIAQTTERVGEETGAQFVVSLQIPDIRLVSERTDLPILAQRADASEPGRDMGNILLETLSRAGAEAVVINHAEDRDSLADLATKIDRCVDIGLDSMVCVDSIEMGRSVAQLDPDTLVFEKPDDIATEQAITQTHPERVEQFVEMVETTNPRTKVFVGGGISTAEDVRLAFEQGADATGSASSVVGADDRHRILTEIANAMP